MANIDKSKILLSFGVPTDMVELLEKDELTQEAFDTWKGETWIGRKAAMEDSSITDPAVKRVMGEKLNAIDVDIKRQFKQLGLEVSGDSLRNTDGSPKPFTDWTNDYFSQIGSNILELKETASKGDSDKVVKLETKLSDLTELYNTIQTTAKDLQSEKEQMQTNFDTQVRDNLIGLKKTEALGKISFRDDMSPLERDGFNNLVNALNWNIGEADKLEVKSSDNKAIFNAAGTDTLNVSEVLLRMAEEHKLLKVNNSDPGRKQAPFVAAAGSGDDNAKKISPNSMNKAARLRG